MVYRRFFIGTAIRVILITLVLLLGLWLFYTQSILLALFILGLIVIFQMVEMINYVNSINQKLARFLHFIRVADFSSSFISDS